MSDKIAPSSADVRADEEFGQSLAVERWAIESSKVAIQAREYRMLALECREYGAMQAAERYRERAEHYEAEFRRFTAQREFL